MATSGNKSKFSERLKSILKLKKRKKNTDLNKKIEIEDSNKIYMNFVKVLAAIPGLVYGNVTSTTDIKSNNDKIDNAMVDDKDSVKDNFINFSVKTNSVIDNNNFVNYKKIENKRKIDNINIEEIKKIQASFFNSDKKVCKENFKKKSTSSNLKVDNVNNNLNNIDNNDNLNAKETVISNVNDNKDFNKVKELEKSIINIIKKNLIKTVNELEILQSELYILSEVNGESKVLKDCQNELNQVKNILCKIDKLKEQYDFLKDNFDFEYLLEIDDDNLVDRIIELKDAFGNNEARAVTEDYKLLDVYKYLYLKIDKLQEKVILYEDKKKDEEIKLKERDINFEKLKNDVYNVDYVNRNYEFFVKEQNELLKTIDDNISKINSYEQVNYRLKGFNELFKNSFKYFGLLMVSPLKGIIPSIATETLLTGNLIKNLYKNLEWEESRRMVFEATDYSNMIENAIRDLESTNNVVDATLDDIVHLKMEYNDRFKKYQGDFLEYKDVMHKITDMENKILGNKIKIELMRKKALDQQMINEKKLRLVKELNSKDVINT